MKKKLMILVIILPLVCYMVCFFPVQRYLAEKAFNDYILLQGASAENIQSKRIYKDYKQDGYSIDVVYKDDPEYRYATWTKEGTTKCVNTTYKTVSKGTYRLSITGKVYNSYGNFIESGTTNSISKMY